MLAKGSRLVPPGILRLLAPDPYPGPAETPGDLIIPSSSLSNIFAFSAIELWRLWLEWTVLADRCRPKPGDLGADAGVGAGHGCGANESYEL